MTWNVRMKNKFEFHDRICARRIFYFFFIRLSFFACSTWPHISNDSCLVLTHILASCTPPPMINVNPCKCLISSFSFASLLEGFVALPPRKTWTRSITIWAITENLRTAAAAHKKEKKESTTLASQPSIWTFWTEQITFFILTHSLIFLSFRPFFSATAAAVAPAMTLGIFLRVRHVSGRDTHDGRGIHKFSVWAANDDVCVKASVNSVWADESVFPLLVEWMKFSISLAAAEKKMKSSVVGSLSEVSNLSWVFSTIYWSSNGPATTQWRWPSTARQWECEKKRDDWGSPCRQSSGGITSATVNFRKGKLNET